MVTSPKFLRTRHDRTIIVGLFLLANLLAFVHANDLGEIFKIPSPDKRGFFLSVLQALQSFLASIWLLAIHRGKERAGNWEVLLPLFFLSLGLADLNYGIHYYLLNYSYQNTPWMMVHQGPYILAMLLLAQVTISRALSNLKHHDKMIVYGLIGAISGFYFLCSYEMVLSFSFPAGYARPRLNLVTSYIYAVFQAMAVGGLIMASLRTPRRKELYQWFLLLMLNATDFALRYQDVRKIVDGIAFEDVWLFCNIGSSCLVLSRLSNEPGERNFSLPPVTMYSFRVFISLVALAMFGLYFVINLLILPYFHTVNVATISSHALSFGFVWLAANEIGLIVSLVEERRVAALSLQIEATRNPDDLGKIDGDFVELRPLIDALKRFKKQLVDFVEQTARTRSLAAVADAASKTVHRIQSPLCVLKMMQSEIPPHLRKSYDSCVLNLEQISSELKVHADHHKANPGDLPQNSLINFLNKEKLSDLLETAVKQKRLEYKNRSDIAISLEHDDTAQTLYSEINPVDFHGLISDLMNNSIEALPNGGFVKVRLVGLGDSNLIQIIDNGLGIAPEHLSKIGTLGFTFGKETGTGRGTYDAKRAIESWDGTFLPSSEPGSGTVISIELPRVRPPQKAVSKIIIPKDGVVCIVDDNPTMHQFWQSRLEQLDQRGEFSVVYHQTPSSFSGWFQKTENYVNLAKTLFLMDYEFEGHEKSGLDLIEESNIAGRTILVTGLTKPDSVSKRCFELGVRYLDKADAKVAEIRIEDAI